MTYLGTVASCVTSGGGEQAMIPFSEDELEYIARLDAEADMDLLRRELPSLREESLRTLQVATILLQRCAAAGVASPPSLCLARAVYMGFAVGAHDT